MPSLTLHSSNRMEHLVDALAQVVSRPLAGPLVQEVISVQSRGMERWLAIELSHRFGVWGNCRYPFPGALVAEVLGQVAPEGGDSRSFEPQVMALRILRLLPELITLPVFDPVARYLADDDPLKRYQLATRLASLLDQYAVFRPQWLLAWERGEEQHWQAELFRRLLDDAPGVHRAAQLRDFRQRMSQKERPSLSLPERISFFGLSSLPPYHLEVFRQIGRCCDVHLFVLNPCRDYWFDLPGKKARQRSLAFDAFDGSEAEAGHPLLVSLGGLGKNFHRLLFGRVEPQHREHFAAPGRETLLKSLQSDLLDPWAQESESGTLCEADNSLQIHNCHSPLREVEVLHDQLLNLFEIIPDLQPRDVVVMTPEIDRYAPYVSAVFDAAEGRRQIPYHLADRSILGERSFPAAFFALLELRNSRFTVNEVLDLLEREPIRKRFGILESDLPQLIRWVEAAGIRWGIDPLQRKDFGLPPEPGFNWEEGLERLLLSLALPEGAFWQGRVPAGGVTGQQMPLLGRFCELLRTLVDWTESLKPGRTLSGWSELLCRFSDALLEPEGAGQEHDAKQLRELFLKLVSLETDSVCRESFPAEVVVSWLREHLGAQGSGGGFLAGGVSFCALLPMRSVPFRVVALLGMNDGDFPRLDRPLEFDLMSQKPEAGDPGRRDEDRYLFLEAILSARDVFYVSYVGQSIRDNSASPPSVVVSELLDALDERQPFSQGDAASVLVTHHPLQPFSPKYFAGDERLYSYSTENARAAGSLGSLSAESRPFLETPLAQVPQRELPLAELIRFFKDPCLYFLKNRLHVTPFEERTSLPETEPFHLEGLERYALLGEMIDARLRGTDQEAAPERLAAAMRLPPATLGRHAYEQLSRESDVWIRRLSDIPPMADSPVEIELVAAGWRLSAAVHNLFGDTLVNYRPARLKGVDLLVGWIEHLALCCAGAAHRGFLVLGSDRAVQGTCKGDPQQHLEDLLRFFEDALCSPQPFFPETSLAYARAAQEGKDALSAARRQWLGDERVPGESTREGARLCFGTQEVLGEDFETLARRIYDPLLQSLGGGP